MFKFDQKYIKGEKKSTILENSQYISLIQNTKIINNDKKYFDIGLSLLRVFICYFVIIAHCYNRSNSSIIFKKINSLFKTHVLIFFIMGFYFSYKTIISSNPKQKIDRLKRLIIPYFLWPIILWFINKIVPKDYKISKCMTIEDLIYQLLYGSRYLSVLWFQWDLIMLTIVFYLIYILFKKMFNFILIMLSISSFIYQYNGHNIKRFKKEIYDKKYTFGRFLEILPMAVIGVLFNFTQILNYFKKFRLKTFFTCIFLIYLFQFNAIFINIEGYMYQGFQRGIIAILLFIIFAMFPSESIKNKKFLNLIKIVTNHTACVYYLHKVIPRYCKNIFPNIRKRTAFSCLIIYFVCYLIGLFGSYICKKTFLINLFQ